MYIQIGNERQEHTVKFRLKNLSLHNITQSHVQSEFQKHNRMAQHFQNSLVSSL